MSPEYNFHLRISAKNEQEANDLRNFILRIRGIEEITPLDRFKLGETEQSINIIDLTMPIGEVVKRWREARGLRPIDVIKKTGDSITRGYYSELERGKIKNPGDTNLGLIASALNVSMEDIRLHKLPPESSNSK